MLIIRYNQHFNGFIFNLVVLGMFERLNRHLKYLE
ncbi:hypothetical protein CGSSa00_10219 [Staphylococcus aureus subsp. aureus CGS00]|nr:hypothetical protein CGSSa00_10219 [Staphylococcus aureus subsp. aureus CGS00]